MRGHGIRSGRRIEELKRDLEQRIAREVSLRREILDEPLERNLAVRESVEGDVADAFDHLVECRGAAEVEPQDDCVDEEPDQLLELCPVASGDRRADHDLVLVAPAPKDSRPRGQQSHEQSCPARPRSSRDAVNDILVKVECEVCARVGLNRRTLPISR